MMDVSTSDNKIKQFYIYISRIKLAKPIKCVMSDEFLDEKKKK